MGFCSTWFGSLLPSSYIERGFQGLIFSFSMKTEGKGQSINSLLMEYKTKKIVLFLLNISHALDI